MRAFLHIVTEDLIERLGVKGLERVTMVFPMQRAGLFVKQYLSERVLQSKDDIPMVLPRFTTIDALADSLCELQADEEISSVCALYEIYKKHTTHTLPIDAFYGWGVQLLADFSSADMALLDVDRLMHYTADAAKLEDLVLEPETKERLEELLHTTGAANSIKEYFTSLWAALPQIYEDFHALQLQAGVGTRGERTRWVIENFQSETIQQRIKGRTFVFVGFNYLLGAERKLMQLLRDNASALFYWDYNPDFHLDDEVYKFIKENIKEFGNALPSVTCNLQPALTAIACQSSSAQAQYVRDWLLAHHKEGDKTAIVIADESILQAVVYALPDRKELNARINITKGYPLRTTHLYADVMALFETHKNEPLMDIVPKVIGDLAEHYQSLERPEKESWLAVLLDESYYQIQLVLRQVHVMLLQNEFIRQCLGEYRVLRNLVRRKLEMVTIPFHGEPITDIQIIGVLETRLLDFDHVLILNVEEDVVPAKANDRSFLPFDLRREYRMSTREEEAKIYAYNFFRLMRRAQDVTLCFSDSFTELGKKTMSRFLMQMLCAKDWKVERLRLNEAARVETFALAHTIFTDTDTFPNHLSPSSISEYIECPRQFYLKRICGIEESQTVQVMLPQNVFGSLVHNVLKQAYTETNCDLNKALEIAYNDPKVQGYKKEEHEAENHALLSMVRKVLQKDKELPALKVLALEKPVHKDIPTSLGNVRLVGVIDRMDEIGEGSEAYVRVLDYKTGGYDKKKMTFNAMDELFDPITGPDLKYALQTLIYCSMVNNRLPLSPELMFPRVINAERTISYQGEPIKDFAQLKEEFETRLQKEIETIRQQAVPGTEFVPCDEKICEQSYCSFHLLCGRTKKS